MQGLDIKKFIESLTDDKLEGNVEIVVMSQGSIGPTPTVNIKNIQLGFDWDNGKILIFADAPIIKLTPEDLEAVKKSLSQAYSYHTSKVVMPLMRENKDMKNFILSLDTSNMNDIQKEYIESLKGKRK